MFILSNYQLRSLGVTTKLALRLLTCVFFLFVSGHYVGMDVHDCSMVSYDRPLKPGFVSSLPC